MKNRPLIISPAAWLPAAAAAAIGATFLFGYFSFDTPAGLWQFAAALAACFLAPGYLLLGLTGASRRLTTMPVVVLSLVTGLIASSTIFYALALAGARWAFTPLTAVIAVVALVLLLAKRPFRPGSLRLRVTRARLVFACLALLIVIYAIPASFTSGRQYPDGLRFYGYHSMDSMWHLARIAEIEHTVPPRDPMDAGSMLQYHVLYHTAVNALHRVSGVNFLDIHFRLIPVFMLLLFASVLYIAAKKISGRESVALWAVALFFFAGDLGFIFLARKAQSGAGGMLERIFTIRSRGDMYYELSAFRGNTFSNVFWSETSLISFVLLFAGLYLIVAATRNGAKFRYGPAALGALCLGAMMQAKVQMGALALGGLFAAAGWAALTRRDFRHARILVIALVAAFVFTAPWIAAFRHEDPQKWRGGQVISRPLVALTTEVVTSSHFYTMAILPGVGLFRDVGQGPPALQVAAWLLFVAFGFGGRIIGVPFMLRGFTRRRANTAEVMMAVMLAGGLLLADFTKILGEGLFSSHFITGIALINYFGARGLARLGESRRGIIRRGVPALLALLMIPMPLFKAVSETPRCNLYAAVSAEEQELYARLREISAPEAAIMRRFESKILLRDESGERTARTLGDSFLMALAGRRVVAIQEKGYNADGRDLEEQLEKSPKWRDVYDFFRTEDRERAREILRRYGVTHVVLSAGEELHFDAEGLLREEFSNGAGRIFRAIGQ